MATADRIATDARWKRVALTSSMNFATSAGPCSHVTSLFAHARSKPLFPTDASSYFTERRNTAGRICLAGGQQGKRWRFKDLHL